MLEIFETQIMFQQFLIYESEVRGFFEFSTTAVVIRTGLEGKIDLLTVVCLFSMEWAWGAARDIWDKASRGSNIIIIFVGREIIVLENNKMRA